MIARHCCQRDYAHEIQLRFKQASVLDCALMRHKFKLHFARCVFEILDVFHVSRGVRMVRGEE